MQPKQYLIPENLAVAVLQYLGTRPYNEVSQMVELLRKLEPSPVIDAATSEVSTVE